MNELIEEMEESFRRIRSSDVPSIADLAMLRVWVEEAIRVHLTGSEQMLGR